MFSGAPPLPVSALKTHRYGLGHGRWPARDATLLDSLVNPGMMEKTRRSLVFERQCGAWLRR